MGQSFKYMCGGTFSVWSLLVITALLTVALHADGFPIDGPLVADPENSGEADDDDALSESPLRISPSQTGLSNSQLDFLKSEHDSYERTAPKINKTNVSFGDFNFDDASTNNGDASNAPHTAFVIQKRANETASSKDHVLDKSGGVVTPWPRKLGRDEVKISGLSIDYASDKRRVDYDSEGSPNILEGMEVTLTLYGKFKPGTYFRFSKFHICDDPKNSQEEHLIRMKDDEFSVGIVDVKLPDAGELNEVYLCLRASDSSWQRQGESKTGNFGLPIQPWLVIKLTKSMFPLYLHVLFIVLLLMLSGLFSGLNLGLMSLDKTELKIIMNTGSKAEKNYAQSIAPVRNHGNFLLCCLLFSNVLVNATLTILVDDLTSGLIAIAGSTLSIVIFGEIIPQAICSRYGLAVGARTIYITKFFMAVTSPLAFPLSIILDKILGEEIGNIYTRDRLKELLKVTKDHHGLENEEVGIISGALDLKSKTVKDVMIRVEHIFMLPADTTLDFDTMAEIEYQGYSRIPVFDGERSNVCALINVRQLTLLDAGDNIPLRTIMNFYKTNLFFVFENTRLDFMFKAFREGSRGHMAFVQRVNDEGPGDPYYETVGMLTMEDVLEEILQADIRDENDVGKFNARSGNTKRPPAVPFMNRKVKKVVEIPATLALAATQFLSTFFGVDNYNFVAVDPFKYGTISVSIIQRLLKTNVQFVKAPKRKARQICPEVHLYEQGKAADSFIMLLEGRVQVTVGKEKLMYEAGPFTIFGNDFLLNDQLGATPRSTIAGESALSSPIEIDNSERPSITSELADLKRRPTFMPDYSVKVITDVYFLRLKYDHYRHAVAATELEKAYCNDPEKTGSNYEWQYEIDKVLDTGDDDDEHKDDPKAGGDNDVSFYKIQKYTIVEMDYEEKATATDKDTSTTSTESDESDNKDTDHDENNPTEETKLLQNDVAHS
ncbi:Metal transporter CNNM2 [Orchesella cincta]|uniref:Metal transporter CNNM2 n=1 Tax=Orchesella cincta TaxID=48709 RepID=A0A1D2NML0_ORCCI|nr:Metal transporter CNNM2 [Orchesella cincta]